VGLPVQYMPLPEPDVEMALRFEVTDAIASALADLPPLDSMLVNATTRERADPSAVGGDVAKGAERQPRDMSREPASTLAEVAARSTHLPHRRDSLAPDLNDLIQLSDEYRHVQSLQGLLDSIEVAAARQPPPVAAVLRLWLYEARRELRSIDPAGRVVEDCQRVAAGQTPRRR
jgi:hypothetical protein